MKHPFVKIIYQALKKSTEYENLVLEEAEKLRAKGYPELEIREVLLSVRKGLLEEKDIEIMEEALEEFSVE